MSNINQIDQQEINPQSLKGMELEMLKKLNPNSFPFWVLPDPVQNIIRETNSCLAFPLDFISSSIFFACGLANGNSTQIQVMKGWVDSSVMYMCLVGRAGTNKSHPLSWALRPIEINDDKNYSRYEKALDEYSQGDGDTMKPQWQRIIMSDFTIEALTTSHKFNLTGLGVHVDELSGWIGNMNRYNAGSELQFWLTQWSGKRIVVDRKSSKSIAISNPFISVIGTIQNGLIQEISNDKNNKNGFTDRILWVVPCNLKKEVWSEKEISLSIEESYANIIANILKLRSSSKSDNEIAPNIVKYDKEAFQALKDWQAENTKKYNNQSDNLYDGIISKHEVHINRFALTLQIMFDACENITPNKITLKAVKGAVEISEYFLAQSKKIVKQGIKKNLVDKLPGNKKAFYNDLPNRFKTAQALEIGADGYKLNERYVKRFIANEELFNKYKHAHYEKVIS